jgi:hypothetical protein
LNISSAAKKRILILEQQSRNTVARLAHSLTPIIHRVMGLGMGKSTNQNHRKETVPKFEF